MKWEYQELMKDLKSNVHTTAPGKFENAVAPVVEGTQKGKPIIFSGPSGTGKTWAVCGLINKIGKKDRQGTLFLQEGQLMDYVWQKYALDYICEFKGVVIIDDIGYKCFGTQTAHEWIQHCIYTILNQRDMYERSTVMTTNLSKQRMSEAYGPMVASRAFGGCVMETTGEDKRKQKEN